MNEVRSVGACVSVRAPLALGELRFSIRAPGRTREILLFRHGQTPIHTHTQSTCCVRAARCCCVAPATRCCCCVAAAPTNKTELVRDVVVAISTHHPIHILYIHSHIHPPHTIYSFIHASHRHSKVRGHSACVEYTYIMFMYYICTSMYLRCLIGDRTYNSRPHHRRGRAHRTPLVARRRRSLSSVVIGARLCCGISFGVMASTRAHTKYRGAGRRLARRVSMSLPQQKQPPLHCYVETAQ